MMLFVGMPSDFPAGAEDAVWERGWKCGNSQPATVFSISLGHRGQPLVMPCNVGIQGLLGCRSEQRLNMSHLIPIPQVHHKEGPPSLCQPQRHLGSELPAELEAELNEARWQV